MENQVSVTNDQTVLIPKKPRMKYILISFFILLFLAVGITSFYFFIYPILNKKSNIVISHPPSPTEIILPSPISILTTAEIPLKGKLIAYLWDGEIWVTDLNGTKKFIYSYRSDPEFRLKTYLQLFMSSDNKLLVWDYPPIGLYRFDLVTNILELLVSYPNQERSKPSLVPGGGYKIMDNKLYYFEELKKQFVSIEIRNGNKKEIKIPQKFNTVDFSPGGKKVLLSVSYEGPMVLPGEVVPTISVEASAIMNTDGTGYIELPSSFRGHYFTSSLWTNESNMIFYTSDSNDLASFDTVTGKEKIIVRSPSKDNFIDYCRFWKRIIYCMLRNEVTRSSHWYEVKGSTLESSNFSLPQVSDKLASSTQYYYDDENDGIFISESFNFGNDSFYFYDTLWYIDSLGNKKQIIGKYISISLPLF